MSTDRIPEILVILEPRKLIGQSLYAAFTATNVFSNVYISSDFSETIEPPVLFLVAVHSYLQASQTLQLLQSMQPDATIVVLDEQFRIGGGLLVHDAIVHGYWTLHDSVQEITSGLIRAIRRAPSISPSANDYLRHSRRKGVQIAQNLSEHPFYKLSRRERQMFLLIASGKKTDACAAEMSIAKKTAYNLREKLMKKFNVKSATDLVWKVIEIGLVPR